MRWWADEYVGKLSGQIFRWAWPLVTVADDSSDNLRRSWCYAITTEYQKEKSRDEAALSWKNYRSASLATATAGISAAAATTAAVATTATATTTAVATTATTAATGTAFFWLGFIDGQGAATIFLAVERGDGRCGLGVATHFDKAKALASASVAVGDDLCALHRAVRGEQGLQG